MLWVFGLFIDIQGSYGTRDIDIYLKEFTFPAIALSSKILKMILKDSTEKSWESSELDVEYNLKFNDTPDESLAQSSVFMNRGREMLSIASTWSLPWRRRS